jgi:tripartite-type tricarboxylate transporter receptor subunit TctC
MVEAGVPDYGTDVFFAVIGPAGMPRAAVERTSAALRRGLSAPGVEERFRETLGLEVDFTSPEETRRIIASEIDRWAEIVRISGARAD